MYLTYLLVELHCRDCFTADYLQKIEFLISRWKRNNRITRLPGVIDIKGDCEIAVLSENLFKSTSGSMYECIRVG